MRNIVKIFISFILLFAGVSLAVAQDAYVDVNPAIPGSADAQDPAGIVANFYTFALTIGGVLAFGAIVWGGIKYIAAGGNSHTQSEGKEWIKSALWGLLLLVGASIVLNTINPRITSLSLPGLEGVSNYTGGGVVQSGGRPVAGGACRPLSVGPASVEALRGSCFGSVAEQASAIAMAESAGDPLAAVSRMEKRCPMVFSRSIFPRIE